MARAIAIVVGALILAAVAHVTIQSTGGYGTPHSWLTIAVATGVATGSVFSGMAWADDRRTLAIFLVLAIVAGEGYGFLATAERLIVSREAAQAPLRQLAEDRARSQRQLDAAAATASSLPTSTARLDRALADKATTDAAVVIKSAERGCVENCRRLLQAQADATEQEVARARDEMARQKHDAEASVARAKTELESLKPPASATPLADRLGWPAWVLDLLHSALGSIAANGLACLLMVFGAHRQHASASVVEAPTTIDVRPSVRNVPRRRKASDPVQHAKDFAVARLTPDDSAEAATDVRAILRDYGNWCRARGIEPLPAKEIATVLADLFESVGIPIEKRGGAYLAKSISLKSMPGLAFKPTNSP